MAATPQGGAGQEADRRGRSTAGRGLLGLLGGRLAAVPRVVPARPAGGHRGVMHRRVAGSNASQRYSLSPRGCRVGGIDGSPRRPGSRCRGCTWRLSARGRWPRRPASSHAAQPSSVRGSGTPSRASLVEYFPSARRPRRPGSPGRSSYRSGRILRTSTRLRGGQGMSREITQGSETARDEPRLMGQADRGQCRPGEERGSEEQQDSLDHGSLLVVVSWGQPAVRVSAEGPGFPLLAALERGHHDALVAERGPVGEADPQASGLAGVEGVSESSEAGCCGAGPGTLAGGLLALLRCAMLLLLTRTRGPRPPSARSIEPRPVPQHLVVAEVAVPLGPVTDVRGQFVHAAVPVVRLAPLDLLFQGVLGRPGMALPRPVLAQDLGAWSCRSWRSLAQWPPSRQEGRLPSQGASTGSRQAAGGRTVQVLSNESPSGSDHTDPGRPQCPRQPRTGQ